MQKVWMGLALSLTGVMVGCSVSSSTNRVEVASDDAGSATTSSKDLVVVSERMSASLLSLPQFSSAPRAPRIAFASVRNETSDVLNKDLFIEKMRTLLMRNGRGRYVFLDREISQSIMNERDMKRSGEVSAARTAMRSGADFFLTGKLSSIEKQVGRDRSVYTRYAFRLTDAETSEILWEDEYEVKKIGRSGAYDR